MGQQNEMKSCTIELSGQTVEYALLGKSGPTIVLVSGLGDTLRVWKRLIDQGEIEGRLLLYNRAGYGKSKSSNEKRDSHTIAEELHGILHHLQLEPPYILVGHSLGCAYVQVYTNQYREEVGGMLLLDPMTAEMDELCLESGINDWQLTKFRKHIASLLLPKGAGKELWHRELSLEQAKRCRYNNSSIPVVIVTAGRGMSMFSKETQGQWHRSHESLVQRIPGCRHIIAEDSKHHIQIDNPAIIVETLKALLSVDTEVSPIRLE